jgi:hypothetical protein
VGISGVSQKVGCGFLRPQQWERDQKVDLFGYPDCGAVFDNLPGDSQGLCFQNCCLLRMLDIRPVMRSTIQEGLKDHWV